MGLKISRTSFPVFVSHSPDLSIIGDLKGLSDRFLGRRSFYPLVKQNVFYLPLPVSEKVERKRIFRIFDYSGTFFRDSREFYPIDYISFDGRTDYCLRFPYFYFTLFLFTP